MENQCHTTIKLLQKATKLTQELAKDYTILEQLMIVELMSSIVHIANDLRIHEKYT